MVQKTTRGEALRLFEQSLNSETDECVIWPFARSALGYAVFGKQRGEVRSAVVARVVCAEKHGLPPTSSHEAAHSCGNGHLGCINHRHLSWKTSKENKADQILHGTRNFGERNGSAKIAQDAVLRIRRAAASRTQREVAQAFGINQSTVSDIVRGKIWGWIK